MLFTYTIFQSLFFSGNIFVSPSRANKTRAELAVLLKTKITKLFEPLWVNFAYFQIQHGCRGPTLFNNLHSANLYY